MSHIEIKLVAGTAADLSALIAGLHAQLAGADQPVVIGRIPADAADHAGNDPALDKKPALITEAPAADKPAANTPTDTAGAADEGKSSSASNGTAPEGGSSDDAAAIAYTDVQKATTDLAKAKGNSSVRPILASFNVDHATKLTEAQWSPYIEACRLAAEG